MGPRFHKSESSGFYLWSFPLRMTAQVDSAEKTMLSCWAMLAQGTMRYLIDTGRRGPEISTDNRQLTQDFLPFY